MSADRLSMRWILAPFLALALAGATYGETMENPPVDPHPLCGLLGPGDLAVTCAFMANAMGIPISAETDFPQDWDVQGFDALTLATHELFHAIGFTIQYPRFQAKLIPTPGAGANGIPAGSRSYSTNGAAGGIRMVLTPAGTPTHADPRATGAAPWPATGYNQANDIMTPNQPPNVAQTLSATDFAVLADAFGWNNTGITINIVNRGLTHSDVDMAILNNAVAAINAQWPSRANSPVFTWTVAEVVPEPAGWVMILTITAVVLVPARRRIVA